MTKVDDELRAALDSTEPGPIDQSAALSPTPVAISRTDPRAEQKARALRRRRLALLVGVLVMGAAVLGVVLVGVDDAAIYSKGVDELVAQKGQLRGRNVRVLGTLVPGSLTRRDQPCEYRFDLRRGKATLSVRYPRCVMPDTVRDVPGVVVEVTAEGEILDDGVFSASQIMAKCPSKYDRKDRSVSGGMTPSNPAESSPEPSPRPSEAASSTP
jgi:cytochrome c-type biogenesis protein CcmE